MDSTQLGCGDEVVDGWLVMDVLVEDLVLRLFVFKFKSIMNGGG